MEANRKRNKQIKFRVSDIEYEKINEKIEHSGISKRRYLVNMAIRGQVVIYDLKSLFELSAQISRVGNNINQIAKKLNQGGLIYQEEVKYLKRSLESINTTLFKIYNDISDNQNEY